VDFYSKFNTGTAETPVWTVIGGQRGATLSLTSEQIDAPQQVGSLENQCAWHDVLEH